MPRRPARHDDELPELPPLDGEVDEPAPLADDALPEDDEPASLDDASADDLPLEDLFEDALADLGAGEGEDEEAGDSVVGDLADELDEDDGSSWTGDDEPPDVDLGSDLEDEAPTSGADRGEEGPEHDLHDDLDELAPIDRDESLDDPVEDLEVTDRSADEGQGGGAFALPEAGARVRRVACAAAVVGASRGARRLLGAGEGVVAAALDALDDPDAGLSFLGGPEDEILASIAEDGAGMLYAGTLRGEVWRSTTGRDWTRAATLGEGQDAGPVEVTAEGRRVWARTRHGALYRSEDGAWLEGPLFAEHVRGCVADESGVAVVVGTRARASLRTSSDGGRTWTDAPLPAGLAPWLVARAGEVWLVAPGAGQEPGHASVDGAQSFTRWELLSGATALALVETDDGVAQSLHAVYDEAGDRSVVVVASLDGRGAPRAPRRLAVLSPSLWPGVDGEAECRVDALIPLDRAGRRVVAVTPRGLALIER